MICKEDRNTIVLQEDGFIAVGRISAQCDMDAQVSGYGFGRTVGQRLCTLLQENLTAFPAKYSLYDVEPWSKTIRAAIAALFSIITP